VSMVVERDIENRHHRAPVVLMQSISTGGSR
jgi:hypothetical protein